MIQLVASNTQSEGDWNSDMWGAVSLWPGDKVYCGRPGRGIYFTNAETIRNFATSPQDLWEALQVPSHAQHGYRMELEEYMVLYPVSVPAGRCRNNGDYGGGGGFQYMIKDVDQLLTPTGRVLNLGRGAHLEV
ncbi:hypothetical protein [Chondromyces crocatus]|uniref:DUF4237 domain-containing protein n=1 Tax=Chondromyces crocatus TaxID=52 RepID=A0A0K1EFY7_CHOCO|nr:hypothetical protein [Chondromyces crocatus]AKT39498.1 uncharacterized protein CMC5_036450 [Chondromyces crocatus]